MNPFTALFRLFPSRQRRPARRLLLERLEDRLQPSVTWQSIDGTGNNLAHPDWGSTDSSFLRIAPAAYADGAAAPAGAARPSARAISNALAAQPEDAPTNDRLMSNFVYVWGQFIDHDLDLTNAASPAEAFPIAVPRGDPQFDPAGTGTQVIPLNRSAYDPTTGTAAGNPRQQVNAITAWIDGSMVYGSDAATAASLRTFSGGRLRTSAGNLLPTEADSGFFVAGDVRVNENPDLIALHTLFLREHNRLADRIQSTTPGLSDEEIYQRARRLVIAEIQAITFNEFLPALLGPNAPGRYTGYNANVNPGIANEFAAAAYRIGHTLVGDDVEFLDNQGNEVRPALSLSEAFFNPDVVRETGIDPILKYLASDHAQEVDTRVVDSLRNFLFGPPGAGGLDLASLNIQRGRDHGLADYNTTRTAYGLPRVRSFADITSNRTLQEALRRTYGSVNNVDLWVGGLAEDHLPGSSVGPTFTRIIADQFRRLRDGDRFWYARVFSGRELLDLQRTTLADVIRRNTSVTNLQDNVFFFQASITGLVFLDGNRDGRLNSGERGLAGRRVDLLDADGVVVATTRTQGNGSYRFDGLDLGTYRVREVLPPGSVATTTPAPTVRLTRGMTIHGVHLGEVSRAAAGRLLAGPSAADLAFLGAALDDGTGRPGPRGRGR